MIDILLNIETGLPVVENGDFVLGNAENQNKHLMLFSEKGSWKENPLSGIGLANFLEGDDIPGMLAETRKQFEKDGALVGKMSFDGEELIIDVSYEGN